MLPPLQSLPLLPLLPLLILRVGVLHLLEVQILLLLLLLLMLLPGCSFLFFERLHELRLVHFLLLALAHGVLVHLGQLLLHVHADKFIVLLLTLLELRHYLLQVVLLVSFDHLHSLLLLSLPFNLFDRSRLLEIDRLLLVRNFHGLFNGFHLKLKVLLLCHGSFNFLEVMIFLLFLGPVIKLKLAIGILHLLDLLFDLRVTLTLVELLAHLGVL